MVPRLLSRRAGIPLLALAVISYAAVLVWRVGAYAGGADSSGYLNQARLLRAGKIHTLTRALPELPALKLSAYAYVPLGFSPANPGDPTEMVAIYPIGLPLLIAAASIGCGWNAAPHVTMIAHALAGIALIVAWARTLRLSGASTAVAAAMLAFSPLYIFTALQTLSDLPALVWTGAAVLAAWRGRERSAWAAGAGFAAGMAVLIRPTNALAFLPIAVALGFNVRRWGIFCAAGLPALVTFLEFNQLAYGDPLRTGYGPIGDAFLASYFPVTLGHYLKWLPVVLTPTVLLAGALPWASTISRAARLMLAAWIAAFFGFYLFYSYTHETWWYLRFVMPAFPAVIMAVLAVAEAWLQRGNSSETARGAWWWSAGATAALLLWFLPWNYALHTWNRGRGERSYLEACGWARAHLPANALVFAMQTTGAVYYYTDFPVVHWAFVNSNDVAAIERATRATNRPIFAMLFPFEETPLLRSVFPGNWIEVGAVGPIRFWRRAN